jgi:hypothetical protein
MAFGPSYTGANANYGTDQSLKITRNDNGQEIFLGGRTTAVHFMQKSTIDKDDGITDGGRIYHTRIPVEWEGDITLDRYNGDLTKFMKFLDANFYSGQGQIELTVVQTIRNKFDNSTDINTYTHVVVDQPDEGTWSRTKRVSSTLKAYATERL